MESIATTFEKIKTFFLASLKNGTDSKKNIAVTSAISKIKIIKIVTALILSNIFFYMLFSPNDEVSELKTNRGGVEVIIEGKLMTSFEENKDVLLTQPNLGLKLKGKLLTNQNSETHYLVLVSEEDAQQILGRPLNWNILPYLKNFKLPTARRTHQEIDHEIHF